MVAGQYLVSRFKRQGSGDHVDPEGGVGDIGQVERVATQVSPQNDPCFAQMGLDFPPQKLNRLMFQPALPILVPFKNRPGRCPKRAVIEKDHPGIEDKLVTEIIHSTSSAGLESDFNYGIIVNQDLELE